MDEVLPDLIRGEAVLDGAIEHRITELWRLLLRRTQLFEAHVFPLRTVAKGDGTTASFGSRTGLLDVRVPDRDRGPCRGPVPTLAHAPPQADTARPMKVYLCRPRGFCAGVERAIETVERAIERFGRPIYVRHEIVHNKVVVEDLQKKGAVFVDELKDVPSGSRVIFSAHGVAPFVFDEARDLHLHAIDATCPLVTKVHIEAQHFAKQGCTILLIGHEDHVEVEGVVGEAPDQTIVVATPEEAETVQVADPDRVAVLTQTTLSVDEAMRVMAVLKRRFPKLQTPRKEDICYATTNRQMAVKNLRGKVELWLVIGDPMSSNSNRLREIAFDSGVPAWLVLGPGEVKAEWLHGVQRVGVTSGASTPEGSVQAVVARLRELGATEVEEVEGTIETIEFQLPVELR